VTASLSDCFLRLDRAEKHLEVLYEQVPAYIESYPYELSGEFEVKGEWRIARFWIRKPPDPQWAILVSEFVHHLRAALDNLIWQLVLLNEAEPWDRNQFPVYTKRAPGPRRMDDMLRGVSAEHRAVIEDLQPYKLPGSPIKRALARLVELSNIDKHRSLHPTLTWSREAPMPTVSVTPPSAKLNLEVHHRQGPLHDGADVYWYRLKTSEKAQVHVEGFLPVEVAFGETATGGVGGDALDELRLRVLGIAEHFGRDFPT
jgi:hypothetical protein